MVSPQKKHINPLTTHSGFEILFLSAQQRRNTPMNNDKTLDSSNIAAPSVDARAPLNEFTAALQAQGHIHHYPGAYAKDAHFKQHGFPTIHTEADVAAFLDALDAAPGFNGEVSPCAKAHAIRASLSTPDDYKWGVVERFKMFASARRRVHCSCHETGSFFPTSR